jgi:hypothetical protein
MADDSMSLALFSGVTLTVEIAITSSTSSFGIWNTSLFNTARFGPDDVWQDVSAYVRSFESERTFGSGFSTWQTAKFSIVLNNIDGRFSPDNLTGPYASGGISGIIPCRPCRVSATYAGVTYPIIKGYVTTWDEGWDAHTYRKGDAFMTASGWDEWGRISGVKGNAVTPVGVGESYGSRVNRILVSSGSTAARDIDTGYTTMLATDLSDDPVSELGKVAKSEGGKIFIGADGTVIARDRYSLAEDTRSVNVQVTFGDGGGAEIPWETIETAPLDSSQVINIVNYSNAGGAVQTLYDASSRALYGDCTDPSSSSTDLCCQTAAQVLALAQWTIATNKEPSSRVTGLTIRPRCNPAIVAPIALGTMILDLTKTVLRPPSATSHTMTRYGFISGIRQTISEGDWVAGFSFEPANIYRKFSLSRFDVGVFGASDVDPTGALFFV